ncbi:MAG: beta-Ala-His dipeptidase [Mogibacterium sp.]|nr:beta-Ala-His dipeptidase [Mogibacterium sp.]
MTRIQHGSFHEKPYSDYLVAWAEEHGLRYLRDEMLNVIMYKPASPGYEDHAPVILQGHMDMVCVKEKGSTHDFEKDPLDLYIEDGWLRARGTSLGADDGVGCAYMLAILEDDTLKHPPLECAFTVQEEVGCFGAKALKAEYFQANRMIGLDDVGGGTTYVTTAGSQIIDFIKAPIWEKAAGKGYRLEAEGLVGGHSGVDIDKERGNAIKILVKTLYSLMRKGVVIQLADADAGMAANAIPYFGEVVFTADAEETVLQQHVLEYEQIFRDQLAHSDSGLVLKLTACEVEQAASRKDTEELVSFLRLLPDGFMHKDLIKEGAITTSSNLGTFKKDGDRFVMQVMTRSSFDSYLAMIEEEQILLSELFRVERNMLGQLPGFNYIENSKIRKTVDECFYQVSGRHLEELFVHGGIEAAYIVKLKDNMDIVTIGPLAPDEHTVKESLNLASFDEIYETIKLTLSVL